MANRDRRRPARLLHRIPRPHRRRDARPPRVDPLPRHLRAVPRTRVMLMEGGLVPFVGLLWRLDAAWRGTRTEVPHCVRPPSEYVHDHVAWTTQPLEEPPDDRLLAPAIEGLQPSRTLCFSSDYPHWDFDDPVQTLRRLPAEYRDAVAHANAMRFFVSRRRFRRERCRGPDPARGRARRRGRVPPRRRRAPRRLVPRRRRPARARRPLPARGAPLCSSGRPVRGISLRGGAPTRGAEPALIRCPWHKWDFDIATGRCLVHPRLRVRRYRVTDRRRRDRHEPPTSRRRGGVADTPATCTWASRIISAGPSRSRRTADHDVVDRRRIELIEPGVSPAPIHYESRRLDVAATAALVARRERPSSGRRPRPSRRSPPALPAPVRWISLRRWPLDFPEDIEVQRRVPYEARADARDVHRQALAELAHARDWEVHLYDAKAVVDQAAGMLGDRADEVLQGPRATLGPPWTKDHRIALAATIVASGPTGSSPGRAPI